MFGFRDRLLCSGSSRSTTFCFIHCCLGLIPDWAFSAAEAFPISVRGLMGDTLPGDLWWQLFRRTGLGHDQSQVLPRLESGAGAVFVVRNAG